MKISLTQILENIVSSAVNYPENDQHLNEFFLDQVYFLESGFGKKNNIELIVADVFNGKENSDFMELIDIIYRAKNHKIAEKPILQIMQLSDFYFYKEENEIDVAEIFSNLDSFYNDAKPTDYLIKSCSHVESDPQKRLEKYGYLNYFSQSLHNNYLNLLYKQEDLDFYILRFNKAMSDIHRKIKEKSEKFADQITNIIMIGMNIKNLFELLVNELITHNNSQGIIYTKLFFPMLFSQLPLHYISSQNDVILHILKNIELEKLTDDEVKKIREWNELFSKLEKELNSATAIGGISEILNNEGIEVEDLNYFYKKFLQIIQLKIVEIKNIVKHPNSDRLNLCTVFDGDSEREVVCGAGNVHKIKDNNLKTILAQTGQIIPNGMILEPKDIRGVVSDGMLCSLEELTADFMSELPDGIAELDNESITGISPFVYIMNYFNFSDIADVSITPNLGYTLGILNIEELLKSYLLTDYYNLSAQFTTYLNNKENKKIFQKEENSTILCDDEKINSTIIENIFYSTCKSEDYKPLNLSVRNLLISHGFEIYNDIRDNFNYSYIMTGFSFHIIDFDKISGKQLKIIFNEKNEKDLKNGDIVVVDGSKNVVAIPAIQDIESYTFDSKTTKNILFFTFLFVENPKSEPDIGFNKMLQIARRNKLSSNMIYFFERSRINLAFLETAFINIKNSQLTENEKLFFCTNENINETKNWFKVVKFKIADILSLFKKNSLFSYLDAIDENKKNPIVDLSAIGYYCCTLLAKLGIIDYDLQNNSIFEINSNEEDGLYANLPVFKHRTEINYSMDIVAILYKYFIYENGLEIFYDGFYDKFLNHEVNYESQNDDDVITKNPYSYITYSDLNHEDTDSLSFGDYDKLKHQNKLCEKLVNRGYHELCNFSFIDKNSAHFDERFLVQLSSPVNKNLNILRSSILSSLLENLKEVSKKFQENIAIFESGPVYTRYNIFQKNIAGLRFGSKHSRNIYSKDKNDFDFFDIKADFLEILKTYNILEDDLKFYRLDNFYTEQNELIDILKKRNLINITNGEIFDQQKQFFHDGKSAIVFYRNIPIGYLGEIHPKILQDLEFSHNIVGFVLLCESLNFLGKQKKSPLFQSSYQAVTRDFALIFDDKISIDEIKTVIKNSDNSQNEKILQCISIFDIYQDEKLKSQNKKSIAFSLKLQSQKQTLSDKIINEKTQNILNNLKEKLNSYMIFEENK